LATYLDADSFIFPVGGSSDHSGWERITKYGDTTGLGPGHVGEDYDLESGDSAGEPVYATANGIVRWATDTEPTGGYGGVVVIEHRLPNGEYYTSVTGHLAHPTMVKLGIPISKGDLIGYVADDANDGGPWAPHVHFAIRNGSYDYNSYYCGCCNPPRNYWVYLGNEKTCNPPHFLLSNWFDNPTTFIQSHSCPYNGSIGGLVKYLDGQTVSDAMVSFTGCGQSFTKSTDYNGLYIFDFVPAGPAIIRATKNGLAGQINAKVFPNASAQATDIWLNQCVQGNAAVGVDNTCGVIPTPTSQPTPLPSGWNQTYFLRNDLTSQCGTRNQSDIYMFRDSDGGWSPPNGCPGAENAWSVRMERNDAYYQGGNYEFGLFYDDAARLFVDGQILVDGWNSSQHYESKYLAPGNHQLRLEYKNNAGHAILQMWWRGPGALPFNTQIKDPNQWWVNYWGNRTQWQDSVGNLNEGTGFINKDFGTGGPGFGIPGDQFSLRFERSVYFDCGLYRFHLISDDGSRLFIDGVSIPQFDHLVTGVWDTTADLSIQRGGHTFRVDYFENGGNARIFLDWIPLATCTPIPPTGDANDDGKVDGVDYVIWFNHYKQPTNNGPSDGDFNSDGFVDGVDYVIWLNHYNP